MYDPHNNHKRGNEQMFYLKEEPDLAPPVPQRPRNRGLGDLPDELLLTALRTAQKEIQTLNVKTNPYWRHDGRYSLLIHHLVKRLQRKDPTLTRIAALARAEALLYQEDPIYVTDIT